MRRAWTAAMAAALLFVLTGYVLDVRSGLVRRIEAGGSSNAADAQRVGGIELPASASPGATIRWTGNWRVDGGATDLLLDSTEEASWFLDDAEVFKTPGDGIRTVWLSPGAHRIEIRYKVGPTPGRLRIAAAPTGRPLRPIDADTLLPSAEPSWLDTFLHGLWTLAWWAALLTGVWALSNTAIVARRRATRFVEEHPQLKAGFAVERRRAMATTALLLILLCGAALRLDAIAGRYDLGRTPVWFQGLAGGSVDIGSWMRPRNVRWSRVALYPHRDGPPTYYHSDPYTYLAAARAMTWFYTAHWREPVFPYVTKQSLWWLDNQDTAVSVASTACSLLAVWATYLLGAAVWSRPIGLAAALAVSLDIDVVSLASLGWRDDAYMAAFALVAYLMVRYERTVAEGSTRTYRIGRWTVGACSADAVLMGIGAGGAILTRIMAVPLVVAGMAWILLQHRDTWRQQVRWLGLSAAAATLVAAPYFLNCWRVFGDPLYTFNVHGAIYSAAEGHRSFSGSTADYVRDKISRRPIETVDTILQGVTTYPFGNKFHGLNRWWSGIDWWAAVAAVVGLVVLAGTPSGSLLLVVTGVALLPFSLTWTIDADYRFTLFAYPVFLIAAGVSISTAVRALMRWRLRDGPLGRFSWRWSVAALGGALVVAWFIDTVSPSLVAAEALGAGEDTSFAVGARDGGTFGKGWTGVFGSGNVRWRMVSDEATVRLPLPSTAAYGLTLRMDPFPGPLDPGARMPDVEVRLNDRPVATVTLTATPGRVGSYDLVLPRELVHPGPNQLSLRVIATTAQGGAPVRPGLSQCGAVAVWYVRLHPPKPA